MQSKKNKNQQSALLNLASKILEAITNQSSQANITSHEIIEKLENTNNKVTKYQLNQALKYLEQQKELISTGNNTYQKVEKIAQIGKVSIQPDKTIHVLIENYPHNPVLIPAKQHTNAMDNDLVKLELITPTTGKIIEIVKRDKEKFIGVIQLTSRAAFLNTGSKIKFDIFIPPNKLNNAQNRQKAIVKITDWPVNAKNPVGEVLEILGNAGDNETEMHAILAEAELPFSFPDEIEAAAQAIPETIPATEIAQRKDLRALDIFTIDPETAKDFDDALSIENIKTNEYLVGVHIADVSHYVQPNTPIDQEAAKRGTSIYLVDRVIPMLPEKLSNNLCSLRPNEDKLCYSIQFQINTQTHSITHQWIGKSIIHSKRRFTYDEVDQILENQKTDPLHNQLKQLNQIAKDLRKQRMQNGAIAFERSEQSFILNEQKQIVEIKISENTESHQLVEEFMLLANKKIAEHIALQNTHKTFVYRIHAQPDLLKLQELNNYLRQFQKQIPLTPSSQIPHNINQLLVEIKDHPARSIIESNIIRAMAKAEYTTHNIGHYGLGFANYTHFTSPIRRYPDLLVHRLLFNYQNNHASANQADYEALCKYASLQETKAVNAERQSIKYKQVEYMQNQIGQTFQATVSNMLSFGIFVELNNKCEGFIPLHSLQKKHYQYNPEKSQYHNLKTQKNIHPADTLIVQLIQVNLDRRQIDFEIYEHESMPLNSVTERNLTKKRRFHSKKRTKKH